MLDFFKRENPADLEDIYVTTWYKSQKIFVVNWDSWKAKRLSIDTKCLSIYGDFEWFWRDVIGSKIIDGCELFWVCFPALLGQECKVKE